MNTTINQTVYCVAAQEHAVFVRVSVIDGRREAAYETAVLGRLREGYRVLQLRSLLGTRIELCYLFIHVTLKREPNLWSTARELRLSRPENRLSKSDHSQLLEEESPLDVVEELRERNIRNEADIARLEQQLIAEMGTRPHEKLTSSQGDVAGSRTSPQTWWVTATSDLDDEQQDRHGVVSQHHNEGDCAAPSGRLSRRQPRSQVSQVPDTQQWV